MWINPAVVVSKVTWGIGWIRGFKSLKKCTSMASFCPKHVIFQLEHLCVRTLKGDAKFKGEPTGGLQNDIRNLYESSQNSENLHFDVLLLSKAYKVLDKKV